MTVTRTNTEVKEDLLWVAKEMLECGLVHGTAGNLAARLPDGNVVLTPSSLDYREMGLADLVVCDLDGNVVEGERNPTSEKALHLSALAGNADVDATMHCHAKYCTMFALTRKPIPAVIEEVLVYLGGDVPVAEYRTTGSVELAEEVSRHLGDRAAVLMANHGLFVVGRNPKHSLELAQLVELTAEIVWGAMLLGEIVPLPEEIVDRFSGYYRMLRGRS
ncbi:MAG TPA: class II aldolase/adducin family protein [Acidimicrobiia bacterium]|nr:class II aldolase/adducin family protein [Acidimicrobiia bacterium]